MGCCADTGPDGEALVALGMAAAIQLAQGHTAEELGVLAAFFSALGDNLALIAARRAVQEARRTACEETLRSCCEQKRQKNDRQEDVNFS